MIIIHDHPQNCPLSSSSSRGEEAELSFLTCICSAHSNCHLPLVVFIVMVSSFLYQESLSQRYLPYLPSYYYQLSSFAWCQNISNFFDVLAKVKASVCSRYAIWDMVPSASTCSLSFHSFQELPSIGSQRSTGFSFRRKEVKAVSHMGSTAQIACGHRYFLKHTNLTYVELRQGEESWLVCSDVFSLPPNAQRTPGRCMHLSHRPHRQQLTPNKHMHHNHKTALSPTTPLNR